MSIVFLEIFLRSAQRSPQPYYMRTATYVLADTHFNKRMLEPTVLDAYVTQWNNIVRPTDRVFHLGDVAWNVDTMETILPKLNGVKILIKGNHDKYDNALYREYFAEVHKYYTYKNVLFSHAPVCPQWDTTHQFRRVSGTIKNGRVRNYTEHLYLEDTTDMPKQYAHVLANVHGHFHMYGYTLFSNKWNNLPNKRLTQKLQDSVPYVLFTVHTELTPLDRIIHEVKEISYKKKCRR